MKLENCTKAELLWVLRKAQRVPGGSHPIALALSELKMLKFNQRMKRCDKLDATSTDCRNKAIDLLNTYDKLDDIPMDIRQQVRDLLERAEQADKEWAKLMTMDSEV